MKVQVVMKQTTRIASFRSRKPSALRIAGRDVKLLGLVLLAAVSFGGCNHGVPRDPWAHASRNLSKLETDLRGNGLVTVKRPDVWTENRLYPYRREFEAAFYNPDALKNFKPKLTASESAVQTQRLGMYLNAAMEVERIRADKGPGLSQYLALALLQNATPGVPMGQAAFTQLLQAGTKEFLANQSGLDPAMFTGLLQTREKPLKNVRPITSRKASDDGETDTAASNTSDGASGDADSGGEEAATTDAADGSDGGADEPPTEEPPAEPAADGDSPLPPHAFPWMLTDDIEDFYKVPEVAGTLDLLSPFEEQKQKRAFVQQNHMFRIGNEPDDGTRMNGYRLYYMRFMVSVTPSEKTRTGHSAEVMLTPTYPVAEAARDWVAQYVRGMLRERIMRVVEVGLERVIANKLRDYGDEALTWKERTYVRERIEGLKVRVARAERFADTGDCDKAEIELAAARDGLERLGTLFRDSAALAMLAETNSDLDAIRRDCEAAKAKRTEAEAKQQQIDEAIAESQQLIPPGRFADFQRSLQRGDFHSLRSLAGGVNEPKRAEFLGKVGIAESAKGEMEKADEAAGQYAAAVKATIDRLLASLNALGSQQDEDAAAYAHDVGTKLRNEYLGKMRLAQLAYDELSREADWLLRVPNAVDGGLRPSRAKSALCDIVSTRTAKGQSPDAPNADKCEVGPTTLSGAVDLSPQEIVDIRRLVQDAVAELNERIDRYTSPTATLMQSYPIASKQEEKHSLEVKTKLTEFIGVRPATAEPGEKVSISASTSELKTTNAADESDFYGRLRGFFSTDNWPIYTFAVAPFSEAENIGRAIDLNNEVQIRLNAALKLSELGEVDGALEHARAVREELRAVEVNRTVVGLVRGEQNFGWQFNPPYTLPVKVSTGSRYARAGAYRSMPSQTHEVFALVAVPGFLRSMDFGVHYDWTGVQRTDAEVIGTNKAAKYLTDFRGVDNVLSRRTPLAGTDTDDAFFYGELYQQRLELVESSLPLRMMRRVFLPYGDVSERMTNTAGVSNLLPRITRVVPRYLPSEQAVVVTIEGHNFDTGRIDVMIGGQAATKVEVLNEKTIAATVPARGIISDLTVVKRDGRLFNEAKETQSGKKLLHDLEGVVEVIVVTPAGLATDVALLRITKPIEEAKEAGVTGSIPENTVIVVNSLWDQSVVKISLAEGLKEASGTLVFKSDNLSIDLPVTIRDREVTLRDPIGGAAQSTLATLIDKEISNGTLFPHGGHPSGITIKGKLKVEKLTSKAPEKLTVESAGAPPVDRVKEAGLELTFTRPVRIKTGRVVITAANATPGGPTRTQPIEFADLSGSKISVPMSEDVRKILGGWLGTGQSLELALTLENAQRETNSTLEKIDLGVTRLGR